MGTEHKGLWASEGNWAPQPLYYLRFVWPAAGVSPDEHSWAANKGTEQQNRGMRQRLAPGEMVAEIWGLEHGSRERPQGTASNWLGDSAALFKRNEAWGLFSIDLVWRDQLRVEGSGCVLSKGRYNISSITWSCRYYMKITLTNPTEQFDCDNSLESQTHDIS